MADIDGLPAWDKGVCDPWRGSARIRYCTYPILPCFVTINYLRPQSTGFYKLEKPDTKHLTEQHHSRLDRGYCFKIKLGLDCTGRFGFSHFVDAKRWPQCAVSNSIPQSLFSCWRTLLQPFKSQIGYSSQAISSWEFYCFIDKVCT